MAIGYGLAILGPFPASLARNASSVLGTFGASSPLFCRHSETRHAFGNCVLSSLARRTFHASQGRRVWRDYRTPQVFCAATELQTEEKTIEGLVKDFVHEMLYQIQTREPVAREGRDIEGVHDVRVALRKLRVVLGLLQESPVLDKASRKKYFQEPRRRLKKVADALGKVRDVDILLVQFKKHWRKTAVPDGMAGVQLLEAYRLRLMEKMTAALDDPKYRRSLDALLEFVRSETASESEMAVSHFAGTALWAQYELLLRSSRRLLSTPPAPAEELHRVRVLVKNLRYTLNLFEPALGPETKGLVTPLKKLQEELGQLQDVVASEAAVHDVAVYAVRQLSEEKKAALEREAQKDKERRRAEKEEKKRVKGEKKGDHDEDDEGDGAKERKGQKKDRKGEEEEEDRKRKKTEKMEKKLKKQAEGGMDRTQSNEDDEYELDSDSDSDSEVDKKHTKKDKKKKERKETGGSYWDIAEDEEVSEGQADDEGKSMLLLSMDSEVDSEVEGKAEKKSKKKDKKKKKEQEETSDVTLDTEGESSGGEDQAADDEEDEEENFLGMDPVVAANGLRAVKAYVDGEAQRVKAHQSLIVCGDGSDPLFELWDGVAGGLYRRKLANMVGDM